MRKSVAAIGLVLAASTAGAAVVSSLAENFDGTASLGGAPGSTWGNPQFTSGNVQWYKQHYDIRASLNATAGPDASKALLMNWNNSAPRPVVGRFGSDFVELGTGANNTVTLSIDFKLLQLGTQYDSGNQRYGFRIGLFNWGGTNPGGAGGGNYTTGVTDDFGYIGYFGMNTQPSAAVNYQASGAPLNGTSTSLFNTTTGANAVGLTLDGQFHTAKLVLTRLDATTIKGELFLDNVSKGSGTRTVAAGAVQFNEFAYWTYNGTGTGLNNAVAIDNVSIVSVVPEPASLAVVGLAGLPLLRRRRA